MGRGTRVPGSLDAKKSRPWLGLLELENCREHCNQFFFLFDTGLAWLPQYLCFILVSSDHWTKHAMITSDIMMSKYCNNFLYLTCNDYVFSRIVQYCRIV